MTSESGRAASRVVIIDKPRDLSEWLEQYGARIVLSNGPLGWVADFDVPYFVEGSRTVTGKTGSATVFEDQAKAVQSLVRSIRGCRIGFLGPANIFVPEFTGIEEALRNGTHASGHPR